MPRIPGKPESKIKKKIEDVLDPPKDEDLANVRSTDADFIRNKTGVYGGRPEVRQPGVPTD